MLTTPLNWPAELMASGWPLMLRLAPDMGSPTVPETVAMPLRTVVGPRLTTGPTTSAFAGRANASASVASANARTSQFLIRGVFIVVVFLLCCCLRMPQESLWGEPGPA